MAVECRACWYRCRTAFDVTEVADEVTAVLARPEDYLRGRARCAAARPDDGPAFVVQTALRAGPRYLFANRFLALLA